MEGRVLSDSVAEITRKKMEAKVATAAEAPQVSETVQPPQADRTPVGMLEYVPYNKLARKTKLVTEDRDVPYPRPCRCDRLAHNTVLYPRSHKLSFFEWCRGYLTIDTYMGIDDSKHVVMGK